MQFAQGISSKMWETTDGLELNPAVEEVIYDLDEEQFVCLFTVNRELAASFWTAVENPTMEGHVCASLNFFRHRS
jgi:hypothetical protein